MTTPSHLDASSLVDMRRVNALASHATLPFAVCTVQRLDVDTHTYISDLWRIAIDHPTQPHALTHGPHQDTSPALRSDGALFFLSNRPTNRSGEDDTHQSRSQVFMFSPRGGEPQCVSDEPLGVQAFWLLPDSSCQLALADRLFGVDEDAQRKTAAERTKKGPSALHYTSMPVRNWDHWLPMRAPHIMLRDEEGTWIDLTPDAAETYRNARLFPQPGGRFVIIARQSTSPDDRITDTVLDRLDLDTRTISPLHHSPRADFLDGLYSSDGEFFYSMRMQRQDEAYGGGQLVRINLSDGSLVELDLGIDLIAMLEDISHSHIYFSAEFQGDTPLFAYNLATERTERITCDAAGGTHRSVKLVGPTHEPQQLIGLRDTFTLPPAPFICDVTPQSSPRPLATLATSETLCFDDVEITSHEATSTDGEPVQYWVVKPRDHEGPLPALMWIHGGPIGAWGNQWHWRWNSLIGAKKGYAMVLPNPRGSTGFGQAFLEGIWHNNWGGQCYEDLMAVADAVDARDDIDTTRHFAMGGSFGGYMTNWIGTQTDRFRALINHAGLSDLGAFHGVTDLPAWWANMFGIDPTHERAQFDTYSPLHQVTTWTSPVLIIHGQQDYRVPVGEALMMFEALQREGVESELLIYPDENHWILKPGNILSWYGHVFDFLARHGGAMP